QTTSVRLRSSPAFAAPLARTSGSGHEWRPQHLACLCAPAAAKHDLQSRAVMTNAEPEYLTVGAGATARRVAVRYQQGAGPGLFWRGGFNSDIQGTKAQALARWAADNGRACLRFDYSGHGESDGTLPDGTIGRWLEESLAVFAAYCRGPQIIIGSSMGGWIALLLLRELRRAAAASGRADAGSAAGLILIAPAVDFTETLMWEKFPRQVKREIMEKGGWARPSAYSGN